MDYDQKAKSLPGIVVDELKICIDAMSQECLLDTILLAHRLRSASALRQVGCIDPK